jgi:hypothetical protein
VYKYIWLHVYIAAQSTQLLLFLKQLIFSALPLPHLPSACRWELCRHRHGRCPTHPTAAAETNDTVDASVPVCEGRWENRGLTINNGCISIYLSIHPSIHPAIHQSINPSIYTCVISCNVLTWFKQLNVLEDIHIFSKLWVYHGILSMWFKMSININTVLFCQKWFDHIEIAGILIWTGTNMVWYAHR